MKFLKFEEIPIWQQSMEIAHAIYALTLQGSFSKDFALKDQIRRSAISISSNIAEGYERDNNKEFIRFLAFAKASAGEVRSQLHLAMRFGYIDTNTGRNILQELMNVSSSIRGFMSYLKSHEKTNLQFAICNL
jgi:four helix bundle protein